MTLVWEELLGVNLVIYLCFAGMHCTECGYNCHEKCVPQVAKNCTRLRPVSEASSAGSAASNLQSSSATVENASSSPNDETPSTTRGVHCSTKSAVTDERILYFINFKNSKHIDLKYNRSSMVIKQKYQYGSRNI